MTFRQALYRSYYVQRPEVPVEVLGRILPAVDTGARLAAAAASPVPGSAAAPILIPGAAPRALAKSAPTTLAPEEAGTQTEGADATLFHISSPVTLPAGHSAAVPLLDRAVLAERVGVVQQGRAHPLQTLQLRNDTGGSLPAGVLTLYDPTDVVAFAGEARLAGMPVGETRLLEFAEDLRTVVDWKSEEETAVFGVTAAQGVLTMQQRQRWTAHITITAPTDEARRLLLEIPHREPDATLTVDADLKPLSETVNGWRVPVTLKPGKSRTVTAHVDRVLREQTSLMEDDAVLAQIMDTQALSEPARAALRHIVDLRTALAGREQARDAVRAQQDEFSRDEERVRKVLSAVSNSDALHGKLVKSLEADEAHIAALNPSLAAAEAAVTAARTALEQAIKTLRL